MQFDITPILGIDFAHLTVANIILIVIVLAGIFSHAAPDGSKLQKVLNVIGALTFKANLPAKSTATQETSGIVKKITKATIYVGVTFGCILITVVSVISCKPALAIADAAYDLCVTTMKVEPAVVQAATARQLDVLKYTKENCTVVDVLHPFVEYLKAEQRDPSSKLLVPPPAPRALEAARGRNLI
jgi:hypothetical protein